MTRQMTVALRLALAPFMHFSKLTRDQVQRERPGLSFLQTSLEISHRWKALDTEQRKHYEALAAADQKRYLREKEEYTQAPTAKAYRVARKMRITVVPPNKPLQSSRTGRKKNAPLAQPRPDSAYFFFCNEFRKGVHAKNPHKNDAEIARLLAEQWCRLPNDKLVKYRKMHAETRYRTKQSKAVA